MRAALATVGDSDEAEHEIRAESERQSGMTPNTIGAQRRWHFDCARSVRLRQEKPVPGELLIVREIRGLTDIGTIAEMRDFLVLLLHLIVTIVRLIKPGGYRSVVAESACGIATIGA